MTTLADDLVPDELWAIVEPLLPAPPRPPYGGRHRTISDRACLAAIIYMARTSTPWRLLPARELGCGSPATCWRRPACGPWNGGVGRAPGHRGSAWAGHLAIGAKTLTAGWRPPAGNHPNANRPIVDICSLMLLARIRPVGARR
jgi:transposase